MFPKKFTMVLKITKQKNMRNLISEKGMGKLPEEGFQKHRGNVNILIGE